MDRNMTVWSGRPARERPSRASPTTAIRMSHALWKRRYSATGLPNMAVASSGGGVGADRPRDPEAVHQHAEALGPEGLLDRHVHGPARGQGAEDPVRVLRPGDAEGDEEALGLLVPVGWGV